MSDFFNTDDVVKEYDAVIFKRILAYIKPHKVLLLVTFLSLSISTLGELFVPILEQQLLDNAILSKYFAINLDKTDSISHDANETLARIKNNKGAVQIKNVLYVPINQKLRLTGKVEKELSRLNILDVQQWYVYKNQNQEFSAMRIADLKMLSKEEIKIIRGDDLKQVSLVVIFLFGVLILVFFATFLQTWCSAKIGQNVMKAIRLDLLKKTIAQSTDFLSRHPVGRIVTRLTGDVETINEFFTSFMVALMKDLFLMLGVLLTLFFLSPPLTLVVIALLPPVLLCTNISRIKARDAFRAQRSASSALTSYLSERLAGLQIVQLFVQEKKSRAEYAQRNKELLDANISEINVFATFRPIVEFFATLTTASVIAVGAAFVLNISLSIGVLIAFINLVAMFYAPIMDISEKYTILQSAMAGGERVFSLLDTNESIPNTGTKKIEMPVKGNIEFRNVRFSYKKGEEILKGMSFCVKDGESAAIVGYTGAGKTTIINVLSRLWDIDSGSILLNGVDIKNIPLQDLRKTILPVLQDVFLFSGTVKDNICMGKDLSMQQIEEAAKSVAAHEFILRLPNGYDTILAEGASNISAGQKQLLSFARVLAHDPAIVVLDEATSSIDSETEHLVQHGIEKVLAGRTSLVIAHRLSTIRGADKIFVLKSGILSESGRHEELIKLNGLYAMLYKLQFSNPAD